MWGNRNKQIKSSEFFKGTNIFEKLFNSTFGKVKQTFLEIFTKEDIEQYTLPKVIVIGNESTGKSSLLENITKCQLFPRDSKLCTKCPIHIKLTHGSSKYSIKYDDHVNKKKIDKSLNSKHEIYDVISNYMNSLPIDYISDKEITVEITDENIPTFEFYDLPGIRTYPPETAEMTTKLCKKYLGDKNSIVLCVVPATTTRLTSCQSIALVSEMDMEQNCILALTMADRLQPENIEDLLIRRIIQTSDEIDDLDFAGYVAVVNRIHSDVYSLEENDKNEMIWFDNNILRYIPEEYIKYEKVIKDNITILNLVSKMDELYNKFIHNDWKPRILENINKKMEELNEEYDNLGDENIDSDELNDYVNSCLNKFYNYIEYDDFDAENNDDEYDEIKNRDSGSASDMNSVLSKYKNNKDFDGTEEYYHYLIKTLNDEKNKYLKFDFEYWEKFLVNDVLNKDYCFGRFDNIIVKLKTDISIKLQKEIKNNSAQINDIVKNKLLNLYISDNSSLPDEKEIIESIYKLYKLLVFYPIFNNTYSFDKSEYYESDSYIEIRKNIKSKIEKTQNHLEKISNL